MMSAERRTPFPPGHCFFNSSFITHHSSLKFWGAHLRRPAPRSTDLAAARRLFAARLAKLAASQAGNSKT
jgi:hypothetical protein